MTNITIFEPHGDDALISCYKLLRSEDNNKHIITFSDRSSNKLEDRPELPNVTTQFLNIPDVHYDNRIKYNTYELKRLLSSNVDIYSSYINDSDKFYSKDIGIDFVDNYSRHKAAIMEKLDNTDVILLPFGLFHPNHFMTRDVLERLIYSMDLQDKLLYYIDKPYIEKKYVQYMLTSAMNNMHYTSNTVLDYDKEDPEIKLDIFRECYPTEQGLLRYSRNTVLNSPDMIVSTIINNTKVRVFLDTLMIEGVRL